MGTPYLSEIRIMAFNFPPKGWAFCNGQILSIQQNAALFALLGTTYGGDGRVNFALPNLQGRVPVHFDNNSVILGQVGGEFDAYAPHAGNAAACPRADGRCRDGRREQQQHAGTRRDQGAGPIGRHWR